MRLLDLVVCAEQVAGTGRYDIHSAAQATVDLPALVSSHHGADLLVVQLHGVHQLGALVHCDELLCALGDVQLLCTEGSSVQSAKVHFDDHHLTAVDTDDHRLCDQCVGQWVLEDSRHTVVQHLAAQHQSIDRDVLQLLCAVCAFLLQGLPVAGRTQESPHGRFSGGTEHRQVARIR